MSLGETLKALRCGRGMTQRDLSVETGIPLQSLINYENDRREPSFRAVLALEQYFGITCKDLLEGGDGSCALSASSDVGFTVSVEEKTLLCSVRQFSDDDKKMLENFVAFLLQKGRKMQSPFSANFKDGSA